MIIHLVYNLQGQIGLGYQDSPALVGSTSLFVSPTGSIGLNPAGIHDHQQAWSGMVSAHRIYNTDLSNYNASIINNQINRSIGLRIAANGIDGFERSSITGVYAMQLSDGINIGIGVNYNQLTIEGLGNQSSINTTVGLKHDVSDKLSYEIVGHNLLPNSDNSGINRYGHVALAYNVSSLLTLYNSLYVDTNQALSYRPGLLYNAYKSLSLNVAFDTANSSYGYGAQINLSDKWSLYASLSNHLRLGSSLGIAIEYSFSQDH